MMVFLGVFIYSLFLPENIESLIIQSNEKAINDIRKMNEIGSQNTGDYRCLSESEKKDY